MIITINTSLGRPPTLNRSDEFLENFSTAFHSPLVLTNYIANFQQKLNFSFSLLFTYSILVKYEFQYVRKSVMKVIGFEMPPLFGNSPKSHLICQRWCSLIDSIIIIMITIARKIHLFAVSVFAQNTFLSICTQEIDDCHHCPNNLQILIMLPILNDESS